LLKGEKELHLQVAKGFSYFRNLNNFSLPENIPNTCHDASTQFPADYNSGMNRMAASNIASVVGLWQQQPGIRGIFSSIIPMLL
jgi:hypothetical protein